MSGLSTGPTDSTLDVPPLTSKGDFSETICLDDIERQG